MVAVNGFPIRYADPECALPAGRVGYDITAESLLLHTIQTAEAFDCLRTSGMLVPDPRLACPDFDDAYDWMCRRMAARLPTSGDSALWLWARIRRRELVDSCRRSRGSVLLTCRVPRQRLLLSHFDDWHMVLNRVLYVPPLTGESDDDHWKRWEPVWDAFVARCEAAGVRDQPLGEWPDRLRGRIERSWEAILDPANYGKYERWQATVHALHTEDVVEAVRILP